MKKIVNYCLCLLILVLFASCSQGFGNRSDFVSGNEKVNFNFRANTAVEGGTLTVTASDGSVVLEEKQQGNLVSGNKYTLNFSKIPAGKTIDFSAKVSLPSGDTLYQGSKSQNIVNGKNTVSLILNPFSGYFLWDVAERKGKVSYSMKDNLAVDFSDGYSLRGRLADFCFDNKGGVWVLNKNKSVANIKHGQKGMDGTEYNSSSGANDVYSICSYIDGFLIGGSSNGARINARLDYVTFDSSVQSKMLAFEPDPASLFSKIYAIAVVGDKVFLGTDSFLKANDFQIFQGTINMSSAGNKFMLNETPVFTSVGAANLSDLGFKITDLQVVDNNLYVLVVDTKDGAEHTGIGKYQHNSRGAVIQISIDNPSSYSVKGLLTQKGAVPDSSGQEAYIMGESDSANLNKCFLGPRKFIAIKPKELVIADAGVVNTGSELKLKKRVVSISTQTIDVGAFAFSGISNLQSETIFDGSVSTSAASVGNDYIYNTGLEVVPTV